MPAVLAQPAAEAATDHLIAQAAETCPWAVAASYEALVAGRLGAFYTPRAAVEATVDAALDGLGSIATVLDPAVGAGQFLLALAERGVSARAFGIDRDPEAIRLAGALLAGRGTIDLTVADALLDPLPCGLDDGVDLVLGNPPFLSVKRGELAGDAARLRERYALARGQWDAYMLFVERCLPLLRPGGRLAFILPRPALCNQHAEPLRRWIAERGAVLEVVDLGRPFGRAEVETVAVVIERGGRGAVRMTRLTPDGRRQRVGRVAADWHLQRRGATLPVGVGQAEARRLARLEAGRRRLGELVRLTRGLEIGKRDPAVLAQPAPGARPLLRGEDVTADRAVPGAWIALDRLPAGVAKPAELFEAGPKLLVRRVASRPIAALDRSGAWALNTLYVLRPTAPDVDLDWLAAILNSDVAAFWFRAAWGADEALFPYLRAAQLRALPLPSGSLADGVAAAYGLE